MLIYIGQMSEEMQQLIQVVTFFCFSLINFEHLHIVKCNNKITSKSIVECGNRIYQHFGWGVGLGSIGF